MTIIWCRMYGNEIGLWLSDQLAQLVLTNGDTCIDNHRVAEENTPSMGDYENSKSYGCCGFEDVEITHEPSGRKFMIGFNYGH